MNFEAIIAVGISCFVLAAAYFMDRYQDRLFRQARPSQGERARNLKKA